MKLTELLNWSGLDVLDHLEREVTVPVVDGIQAQGDLIVIPLNLLGAVNTWGRDYWLPVPADGVELVRGEGGNNPHTLVADTGTCRWSTNFRDRTGLGIAVFENTEPAYLVHPEHGGSGVAPGSWLVRRQQERGIGPRGNVMVCD